MKRLLALTLLSGSLAVATPVTWTIVDGTFGDGGTLSGNFTIDLNKGQILNWDVVSTDGSSLAGFDFTPSTSNAYESSSTEIFFKSINPVTDPFGTSSRYLFFYFAAPLTNAGGDIDLTTATYECDNCAPSRHLSDGGVSTTVPEPGNALALAVSLLMFPVARQFIRKRSARAI